jgi:hypothetical protein
VKKKSIAPKSKKNGALAPSVEWEEITPAIAKDYLARNVTNRNLRESTVKAYERDMRAGNWIPTHQGIAFNDAGELIDGQHRLSAIVRAEVTVRLLVTRGIPRKAAGLHTMDAVDRGANRSVADQLRVQHGYSNPNLAAAAATAIASICVSGKLGRVTVAQTLQILEIYGRQITDIGVAVDKVGEKRLRRSQFVAALSFARQVEPHATDRFLQGMITGAGLAVDSPILLLRNFLFSDASTQWTSSGLRTHRTDMAFLVLNSLLQFVESAAATKLYEGPRGFAHFAGLQKQNLTTISKIFGIPIRKIDVASAAKPISMPAAAPRYLAPIKDAKDIDWKPNAAVDQLLRGKEMSDRAHRRAAAAA